MLYFFGSGCQACCEKGPERSPSGWKIRKGKKNNDCEMTAVCVISWSLPWKFSFKNSTFFSPGSELILILIPVIHFVFIAHLNHMLTHLIPISTIQGEQELPSPFYRWSSGDTERLRSIIVEGHKATWWQNEEESLRMQRVLKGSSRMCCKVIESF